MSKSRLHVLFRCAFDLVDKKVFIGVQCERVRVGDMHSGKYLGFEADDENLLIMLCLLLTSKLNALLNARILKEVLAETFEFPKIIVKVLHAGTLTELVNVVNTYLPLSLGYEFVEIIFINPNSVGFFNVIAKEFSKRIIDETVGELVIIGTYPTNYGLAGKSFIEHRAVYGVANKDIDLFKKVHEE